MSRRRRRALRLRAGWWRREQLAECSVCAAITRPTGAQQHRLWHLAALRDR